jgi:hypothetical protein
MLSEQDNNGNGCAALIMLIVWAALIIYVLTVIL